MRSATQNSAVTHCKSVIVLQDHTFHHSLCCALIGEKGSNVCLKPIRDCKVKAHSAPVSRNTLSSGI